VAEAVAALTTIPPARASETPPMSESRNLSMITSLARKSVPGPIGRPPLLQAA
jgi:hypothetical protein